MSLTGYGDMYSRITVTCFALGLAVGAVCTATRVNTRLHSSPGLQSAEHNHHQLLRPLSEGGARCGPGDG